MRVVVSGGAGFIGSRIVEFLLDQGDEVVVLDSLDPSVHGVAPDAAPADAVPAGAELVVADARDTASWSQAIVGADAGCHQAARVGLGVDFGDVRAYVDHNDVGTAAMLWALHDAGFRGRLVLASSMVVY